MDQVLDELKGNSQFKARTIPAVVDGPNQDEVMHTPSKLQVSRPAAAAEGQMPGDSMRKEPEASASASADPHQAVSRPDLLTGVERHEGAGTPSTDVLSDHQLARSTVIRVPSSYAKPESVVEGHIIIQSSQGNTGATAATGMSNPLDEAQAMERRAITDGLFMDAHDSTLAAVAAEPGKQVQPLQRSLASQLEAAASKVTRSLPATSLPQISGRELPGRPEEASPETTNMAPMPYIAPAGTEQHQDADSTPPTVGESQQQALEREGTHNGGVSLPANSVVQLEERRASNKSASSRDEQPSLDAVAHLKLHPPAAEPGDPDLFAYLLLNM